MKCYFGKNLIRDLNIPWPSSSHPFNHGVCTVLLCPNMSHLKLNSETMELTFISIYKKHLHFTEKQDSYYCKKNLAGFFWESHFSLLISYSDLFNPSFGSIGTLPRYPCWRKGTSACLLPGPNVSVSTWPLRRHLHPHNPQSHHWDNFYPHGWPTGNTSPWQTPRSWCTAHAHTNRMTFWTYFHLINATGLWQNILSRRTFWTSSPSSTRWLWSDRVVILSTQRHFS